MIRRGHTVKNSRSGIFMVSETVIVGRQEKFDELLLDAVDETLKRVFREGTKVIYGFINKHFRLKLEEIAEKPEVFSAGLEKLLGSGAAVIEKLILNNLYRKLHLKFAEKKGYEFSDYIEKLRRRLGC